MADMDTPPNQPFPVGIAATGEVVYGPDVAGESTLRLLGNVEGRRVLELGVGDGHNAVALAGAGAKVIAVDPDPERLDAGRQLAERSGVTVEFHEAELAEFAFVRADTVDLVLSVYALAGVADADRVFRQAHRVLRPEASLVVSIPHPAWGLIDPWGPDPLRITSSWFPDSGSTPGAPAWHTSFADLFGGLYRAGFRVEVVAEPQPGPGGRRSNWWHPAMERIPATLALRARKLGI
jgi:SAM-dependent methyltransferase